MATATATKSKKSTAPAAKPTNKKASAQPTEAEAAFELIPASAKSIATKVKEKYNSSERGTAEAHFDAAVLLAELDTDPDKYGAGTLGLVANFVGMSENYLYSSIAVTHTFDRKVVTSTLDRNGRRVPFNVFIMLAGVGKEKERNRLFKQVVEEGLTRADLSALLAGQDPANKGGKAGKSGRKIEIPKTARIGLGKMRLQTSNMLKSVDAWDKGVFKRLAKAKADDLELRDYEDASLVLNLQLELRGVLDVQIEKLKETRARVAELLNISETAEETDIEEAEEDADEAPRKKRTAAVRRARASQDDDEAEEDEEEPDPDAFDDDEGDEE